jgi:hypothetical protein
MERGTIDHGMIKETLNYNTINHTHPYRNSCHIIISRKLVYQGQPIHEVPVKNYTMMKVC